MEESINILRQSKRVPMEKDIEFERSRHLAAAGDVTQARGLDISSGGLGFLHSQPIEAGSVLKIYLPFEGKGTKIPVFTEVVWSREIDGQYRTGLRFLS